MEHGCLHISIDIQNRLTSLETAQNKRLLSQHLHKIKPASAEFTNKEPIYSWLVIKMSLNECTALSIRIYMYIFAVIILGAAHVNPWFGEHNAGERAK
jgi:hypothetical protein